MMMTNLQETENDEIKPKKQRRENEGNKTFSSINETWQAIQFHSYQHAQLINFSK